MAERLTKSATRNIFYGGSAFFLVVFVALTVHSHVYMTRTSAPDSAMTESVIRGKHVWERNSCINCHSLLGEGAYFAPEVGLASATSLDSGKPVHGTAIDHASTQRCRYSRSSRPTFRIRSSTPISKGFSTRPSIFSVQGWVLRALAAGSTVFDVPNS